MAIYNPKKKYLFVHVYRAGGTSIRRTLEGEEVVGKHSSAQECREEMGQDWYDCFKFAVARNPYDWMTSVYRYIQQRPSHPAHKKLRLGPFRDYLKWYRDSEKVPNKTLCSLIAGVDHVLRFETLRSDWKMLAPKLDVFWALPTINATVNRYPYQEYYDDETRKMVREMFEEDLETFNYVY